MIDVRFEKCEALVHELAAKCAELEQRVAELESAPRERRRRLAKIIGGLPWRRTR